MITPVALHQRFWASRLVDARYAETFLNDFEYEIESETLIITSLDNYSVLLTFQYYRNIDTK